MTQSIPINYVELPADNFDAVQAFYEQVFGWTFTDYGKEYRAFNDGQMDGGFYKSSLQSDTANGAALLVLYSSSLEDTRDRVKAAGGQVKLDIFAFPGGRRFQFSDPHGNQLAVCSE